MPPWPYGSQHATNNPFAQLNHSRPAHLIPMPITLGTRTCIPCPGGHHHATIHHICRTADTAHLDLMSHLPGATTMHRLPRTGYTIPAPCTPQMDQGPSPGDLNSKSALSCSDTPLDPAMRNPASGPPMQQSSSMAHMTRHILGTQPLSLPSPCPRRLWVDQQNITF